jgi:nicotinamidase-related amidase
MAVEHETSVQDAGTAANVLQLRGRYYRLYPAASPLGEIEEPLELDVDETVFLLVDVYGKGYEPDLPPDPDLPSFYVPGPADMNAEIVQQRIVPAKAKAKAAGLRVVYVTNYLSPGLTEDSEWRNMSIRTCGVDVLEAWQPPTPILEHAAIIAPQPGEPVVQKQLYSGFFETHLDSLLRSYHARNLVVVGFDAQICLATTVTEAMYRNYRVIALRDAIRTKEYPETEEGGWANFMAVRFIESNVGYTATTAEFMRACDDLVDARNKRGGS